MDAIYFLIDSLDNLEPESLELKKQKKKQKKKNQKKNIKSFYVVRLRQL